MTQYRSFLSQFLAPWGWAALGAAVFLAIFATIASNGIAIAFRLSQEGADATAVVTELSRSQDRERDGPTRYHYFVSYTFSVGDESYKDRRKISQRFYLQLDPGDEVPVRYWVKDPTLSEIEPGTAASEALFGKIATGIVAVVLLVLTRLGWTRATTARWMVRHGVERQARVTGHVATSLKVNKQPRYRATWTEENGRHGATRMRRRETLPMIGTQITIMVDPEGRRDSIWKDDL